MNDVSFRAMIQAGQLPPSSGQLIVFQGYRPNPPAEYLENGTAAPADEVQYEGVIFHDGTVALRWRTEYRSTSIWASFEDFFHVHGHPEYGTVIKWRSVTELD